MSPELAAVQDGPSGPATAVRCSREEAAGLTIGSHLLGRLHRPVRRQQQAAAEILSRLSLGSSETR